MAQFSNSRLWRLTNRFTMMNGRQDCQDYPTFSNHNRKIVKTTGQTFFLIAQRCRDLKHSIPVSFWIPDITSLHHNKIWKCLCHCYPKCWVVESDCSCKIFVTNITKVGNIMTFRGCLCGKTISSPYNLKTSPDGLSLVYFSPNVDIWLRSCSQMI